MAGRRDDVVHKQWWCCSRCEQQRPRRCGRKPGEALKFRRLTLRAATGWPQRGKLHHQLFVNKIIPVFGSEIYFENAPW
jgi:hypothetical protein